ncbi:MAG TPA: hypothetical protein VGQ71_11725 [Terriglobales bacterium]|nr:hypothetical protein [Terriglobales bacterium]
MAHLYRKAAWGVILMATVAALLSLAAAQSRKKERAPRALAVLALPRDGKSQPRLVPVTILDKGKYFDAALYRATPRPMALEPGTVYEAERNGKSAGFFTVEQATSVERQWVANGKWEPRKAASDQPPDASPAPPSTDADEPPILRRGGNARDTQTKIAVPVQPEDPDRPVLKRAGPASEKPEQPEIRLLTPADAEKTYEFLVAISDANGEEPRPYEFQWNAEEQKRLPQSMAALASAEVVRYARTTPGLKAAPAGTFDEFQIRAFDLSYDNEPELVFTARVPGVTRAATGHGTAASTPAFYVTVVARTDLGGQPQRIFASVTDSTHLDSLPRLALVDAVDSDGNGVGELLFRAIGDRRHTYQLYRVTRDRLWKLFEGGSSAF